MAPIVQLQCNIAINSGVSKLLCAWWMPDFWHICICDICHTWLDSQWHRTFSHPETGVNILYSIPCSKQQSFSGWISVKMPKYLPLWSTHQHLSTLELTLELSAFCTHHSKSMYVQFNLRCPTELLDRREWNVTYMWHTWVFEMPGSLCGIQFAYRHITKEFQDSHTLFGLWSMPSLHEWIQIFPS